MNVHNIITSCFEAQKNGYNVIPYIEGPPGIGKTVIVKDICEEFKYDFKEVILSRYGALDIQGLHVPDYNSGMLKHFPTTRLLSTSPSHAYTVCFFDEFSNSQGDVQAAIQSLFESREIEGHKVPPNMLFVAAGNGEDDGCNARPLPNSILDRIVLIKHSVNKEFVKSWKEWANKNHHLVNPFVIAYIEFSADSLYTFNPNNSDSKKFASPRGWVKLSGYLNTIGSDNPLVKDVACGILGDIEGAKFNSFLTLCNDIPKYSDITNNPDSAVVPKNLNSRFAVIAMIESNLRNESPLTLTQKACENIIGYIKKFPNEISQWAIKRFQKASEIFIASNASTKEEIDLLNIWNKIKD